MKIEIRPISKSIKLKDFDCSIAEMNTYLSRFALTNDKKNISKAFAATSEKDPAKPLGYYTVSMAQILFKEVPPEMRTGLPKYPVPAMRIGKLAVDKSMQNKGLGGLLLKDALLRAVNISPEVAIHCVLVDALNEQAKKFYLKYGFIPFKENRLTLALPIKTIIQSIQ